MNVQTKWFNGISLSPGYGEGESVLYLPAPPSFPVHRRIDEHQVAQEISRFEEAVTAAHAELETLCQSLTDEIGWEEAQIFQAQQAWLIDPEFVEFCRVCIHREHLPVERSILLGMQHLEKRLAQVECARFTERAQDIRDVARRVLGHLGGLDAPVRKALSKLTGPSVVVARELSPSDTIELDRERVSAIVTELGGPTSHAAILARALGIPAVTGVARILEEAQTGDWLLVDGELGKVLLSREDAALSQFRTAKRAYEENNRAAAQQASCGCFTKCGREICLHANLNRIEEARAMVEHNLMGAGLVRTEFLFMNADSPPSFEKHLAAYRAIAQKGGNRPIVLRTLDLGGDKRPRFLTWEMESNPALAARGLRFALEEGRLLRTQLRAMLHASVDTNIRILFPMVLGIADLWEAMEVLRESAQMEKLPLPPIGALIETPAALFDLEGILGLVDFVSIGTNDLTQFMLAVDRETSMTLDFSIQQPGVLKAIRHVIAQAAEYRKELSVCGEAAGDPFLAGLLVGLGCRHLCMTPALAPRVRTFLSQKEIGELENTVAAALNSHRGRPDARSQSSRGFPAAESLCGAGTSSGNGAPSAAG